MRTFFIAVAVSASFAARAQSPSSLWSYPTGAPVLSSPARSSSGVLYFGSYDQNFYAINVDGSFRWSYSVKPSRNNLAAYIYSSPAIADDGTIYFGTEERNFSSPQSSGGTLYALTPGGGLKWEYPIDSAIYSDPAVGVDGTIYFGGFDSYLYALTPVGGLKWRYGAGGTIFSDPVLALDGTVYFGCDDDHLYALNASGGLKWTFNTGGPITASPALGPDGTVYIGTTSSMKFFAIDPGGSKKWEFQAGERIYSSAAIGPDGTIYFGSNDGNLYALYPDGSLKWQFPTGSPVRSSPAIAADGTIYVGCYDGQLYAIDPSGNSIWGFPTADYIYASPAIGPDGTVYFASADNSLYAVQGSSALASSPWPMFRHNLFHNARMSAPPDAPPSISPIPSHSITQNTSTGPLPFTIGDAETSAATLDLSVDSSNLTLVPLANINLSGADASRFITVTPSPNQLGSATITITATDSAGNSAQTSFVLQVTGLTVFAPTIASITNASGSLFTITWSAIPGRKYRVQYSSTLNRPSWTSLAGDVVAQSSLASKQDNAPDSPRFYRVVLQP